MNTGNTHPISEPRENRIAHYRIIKKLGQGGMSIVYEALDERLKRPVALKVLHPFLKESPEYRLRFFREAEAVARLTHPNIVQIFDVASEDATQLYIATELLLGETLKDFIKRIDLMDLPELSAMIMWQVARALEHAHQKGIIHRDIKPENIMVCRDGQIKLMDFGIASLGSEESMTQSGTLLGSLAHMSPEPIKGEKATVHSDIFSLTTVFYWLLTKGLPFIGDTPHALLKAIVDAPHKKVQGLSPYISDDLASVVDMGMKKNPALRFKSAQAMGDAIESALLKMGIAIDIKELQAVLKDPEEKFLELKNSIFIRIKKQLEIHRETNNEASALALACRIDAHPTAAGQRKTASKKRFLLYACVASLLAAIGAILVFSKKDVTMPPPKMPEDFPMANKAEQFGISMGEPGDDIGDEIQLVQKPKSTPEPQKEQVLRQTVEVVIWPFADVMWNGKIIDRGKKSITLSLPQGTHRLAFMHSFAATVEKVLTITEVKKPMELRISLIKSKPAYLVIKSNIDADVAVENHYKGSAKKSAVRPIVIPMPDKTHSITKEIIISQDGYQPLIVETEFIAGKTQELEVQLIPVGKGAN